MKVKRLAIATLAMAMLISVFAIPASASNSADTYYTYEWSDKTSRFDYTPSREKYNITPIYIKNQQGTLPYGGYYIRSMYGPTSSNVNQYGSTSKYLNDCDGHKIANNLGTLSSMSFARIQGNYKNTTYTWGNTKIAWSPDTEDVTNSIPFI